MGNQLAIVGSVAAGLVIAAGAGLLFLVGHEAEGEYFEADGLKLHYVDEGNPEGEPVVLVHGLGANIDLNWRRPGVLARLAKKHRVVALDLRGHGLSEGSFDPEDYGLELADDVIRLMDHLGIAKAHVAGYSLGGFITLNLAARHPDRLLSAAPCAAGWIEPNPERLALLERIVESVERGDGPLPMVYMLEPKGEDANPLKVFVINTSLKLLIDQKMLAALLKGLPQFAIEEDLLRANTVPVLSIVGDADPLKRDIDAMTGVLEQHDVFVIPGGNHVTTPMAPAFSRKLLDFFAANKAG